MMVQQLLGYLLFCLLFTSFIACLVVVFIIHLLFCLLFAVVYIHLLFCLLFIICCCYYHYLLLFVVVFIIHLLLFVYYVVDGCPSEKIGSYVWPETDLSPDPYVQLCSCGSLNVTGIFTSTASRLCEGSFTNGARWASQNVTNCVFDSFTQSICDASDVSCSWGRLS